MGNSGSSPRRRQGARRHQGAKARTLVLCLCVFVSSSDASWAMQSNQAGSDWSQFRGNARLTGIAASDVPANPSLKWTYEGGESFESSPAIADGVVYAAAGNGEILAIDLATGKLRWKRPTGNPIGESSPAVGGGLVYVGDLTGVFHAVRVTDGTVAWTFKTGGEIKSSPVLTADLVLIGSYDTHLYALEAKTGKLRWKLKTNGQVHATPAIV